MRFFQSVIGDYSQTIKIRDTSIDEVEVCRDGKILFKGEATSIIDSQYKLKFKDKDGKQHEFKKPVCDTNTTF
jgi:hypothetical protein